MASTKKPYYKLDAAKHIVTIDTKVIPSTAEKDVVQMYVNAGYTIRFKSEKRAAAARKRAKETGFGSKKVVKPAEEKMEA